MNDSHISSGQAPQEAQASMLALFISDLHLNESLPRTTEAFFRFLKTQAVHARQLYLLGDMFEYWIGDDDIATPYNQRVIQGIREISDAGVKVFWISGNRDFLVGQDFASASGVMLLPDPYVATLAGRRIILTHGDAACTDDPAYMAFRSQVRQPAWQAAFLSQPLEQRRKIAETMRMESRAAQRGKTMEIMDVNADAISALYDASDSVVMIHGHTHRPAMHQTQEGESACTRYVLPDWDCDQAPRRGGWLALDTNGLFLRYDVDGTLLV